MATRRGASRSRPVRAAPPPTRPRPARSTAEPSGSWTGSPRPIAAARGASSRLTSRAPAWTAAWRSARRSMGVASEGTLITARTREILEIPARSKSPEQEPRGDVEVDGGALGERPEGDDVARRARHQVQRTVPELDDLARARVDRDERGLVEEEPLVRGGQSVSSRCPRRVQRRWPWVDVRATSLASSPLTSLEVHGLGRSDVCVVAVASPPGAAAARRADRGSTRANCPASTRWPTTRKRLALARGARSVASLMVVALVVGGAGLA